MSITATDTSYARLIRALDDGGARYRLIDHSPEGRTRQASALRGHSLGQAAKCMVVDVRLPDAGVRHVLTVIPGHSKVDLPAVRDLVGGKRARLAAPAVARELTGCEIGTVVPLRLLDVQLEVVLDPWLVTQPVLFFNAARLDRSVAVPAMDYLQVAGPRLEAVAERLTSGPEGT